MISPILLSFIMSLIITFIYYYMYVNKESEKETKIGNCFSIFLISFILLYLLFIFYWNNIGNENIDKIDTNIQSYKAPF